VLSHRTEVRTICARTWGEENSQKATYRQRGEGSAHTGGKNAKEEKQTHISWVYGLERPGQTAERVKLARCYASLGITAQEKNYKEKNAGRVSKTASTKILSFKIDWQLAKPGNKEEKNRQNPTVTSAARRWRAKKQRRKRGVLLTSNKWDTSDTVPSKKGGIRKCMTLPTSENQRSACDNFIEERRAVKGGEGGKKRAGSSFPTLYQTWT